MTRADRRPPRLVRRARRWWRTTPRGEMAQTLMGIGLLIAVLAAVIVFAA